MRGGIRVSVKYGTSKIGVGGFPIAPYATPNGDPTEVRKYRLRTFSAKWSRDFVVLVRCSFKAMPSSYYHYFTEPVLAGETDSTMKLSTANENACNGCALQ